MELGVSSYDYEKIYSDLLGVAFLIDGAAELSRGNIHPHSVEGLHVLSDIILLIATKHNAIWNPPE